MRHITNLLIINILLFSPLVFATKTTESSSSSSVCSDEKSILLDGYDAPIAVQIIKESPTLTPEATIKDIEAARQIARILEKNGSLSDELLAIQMKQAKLEEEIRSTQTTQQRDFSDFQGKDSETRLKKLKAILAKIERSGSTILTPQECEELLGVKRPENTTIDGRHIKNIKALIHNLEIYLPISDKIYEDQQKLNLARVRHTVLNNLIGAQLAATKIEIQRLPKSDAHFYATDCKGRNALHWAIIRGNPLLSAYIQDKVDMNAQDKAGFTALMYAITKAKNNPFIYQHMAAYLIHMGADLHIADNEGHTALWHAQQTHNDYIADRISATAASTYKKDNIHQR